MPYCPHCKTEYVAGLTVCADCGADLVGRPPSVDDEPKVVVLHAHSTAEARVAEATLEAEGIPAFVISGDLALPDGEFMAPEVGYATDDTEALNIVVPEHLAQRAREILSAPPVTEEELSAAAGSLEEDVEPA